MSRHRPSKKDHKHHLSPAELALAFFSKVDKSRSRRKSARESPCYCAACWSKSLAVNPSRKKHFGSRHSSSPGSSCTDVLSQTSSCTGKSWQSEPPMPSPRQYSLARQSSRSQCICGGHGRGCEFSCAPNSARSVGIRKSKESGVRVVNSSRHVSPTRQISQRIESGFKNNCDLQGVRFEEKPTSRPSEKVIFSNTKNSGVCTESESNQSVQIRRDCVLETVKENAIDEIRYHTRGTSSRENRDFYDVHETRKPRVALRHDVHDAATATHTSRHAFHDKAVGDDRDVIRHDLRELNRHYTSRHDIHQEKAPEVFRHVENSRESSKDRKTLNVDEKIVPEARLQVISSHKLKVCRDEKKAEERSGTHGKSDSEKHRKSKCCKGDDSSVKNSDCSKMSFVMGDQPRYRLPTRVSDRSIATETSGSTRNSSRHHKSRKK